MVKWSAPTWKKTIKQWHTWFGEKPSRNYKTEKINNSMEGFIRLDPAEARASEPEDRRN